MVTASKGYCGFPQLGTTPQLFKDISSKVFELAMMLNRPEVVALFKEGQILFLGSSVPVGPEDDFVDLRFICASNEVIRRMWERNREAHLSGSGD